MLPDGLIWRPRTQYDTLPTGLFLDHKCVAMLLERQDGAWFARLECHWPITAPVVTRDCTSFEAGHDGCTEWALRHLDRLRGEMEGRLRPRYLGDPDE